MIDAPDIRTPLSEGIRWNCQGATVMLGAATALASGQEAEELLDELADIVRQSGRDHQETIKVAMLPAAGNA